MVQNKLLFEDLFCFSTGGWLYSPYRFVQFGYLWSYEEHFLQHYLGHRFRKLFEYIMAICYQLSNLVEVYHEEHFCEFRVLSKPHEEITNKFK